MQNGEFSLYNWTHFETDIVWTRKMFSLGEIDTSSQVKFNSKRGLFKKLLLKLLHFWDIWQFMMTTLLFKPPVGNSVVGHQKLEYISEMKQFQQKFFKQTPLRIKFYLGWSVDLIHWTHFNGQYDACFKMCPKIKGNFSVLHWNLQSVRAGSN